MVRHESGCTNNPNRICKMCRMAREVHGATEGNPVLSLEELKLVFKNQGFEALCESVVDCPACILAVLRQSPPEYKSEDEYQWDFSKHSKELIELYNRKKCRDEGSYYEAPWVS